MRQQSGITLIELLIVVAIMGLLMGIMLPNFIRARRDGQATLCCQNLEALENAKQQWAFAVSAGDNELPDIADLVPYMNSSVLPSCPAAGVYSLNTTGTATTADPATCSLAQAPGRHQIQ